MINSVGNSGWKFHKNSQNSKPEIRSTEPRNKINRRFTCWFRKNFRFRQKINDDFWIFRSKTFSISILEHIFGPKITWIQPTLLNSSNICGRIKSRIFIFFNFDIFYVRYNFSRLLRHEYSPIYLTTFKIL